MGGIISCDQCVRQKKHNTQKKIIAYPSIYIQPYHIENVETTRTTNFDYQKWYDEL